MRTAFLAAVKRTVSGELRAELMLGGRSVLAWQVDIVRALGCERIICLCDAPSGEVLSLQRQFEGEGGEFHAIRSNLQLVSLLRADDELVVLLDGLLADRAVLERAFSAGGSDGPLRKGISTIPAEHTLAKTFHADFERIDKDRHWAGFAVMRASLAQKLADMPPDSDAMSLLLRIALQARVEGIELATETLDNGQWMLATDEAAMVGVEEKLIEAKAGIPSWTGPTQALAASLVRYLAPRGLETGREFSAATAVFLVLCGVLLATLGYGIWGLAAVALGAFAAGLSQSWSKLRAALWSRAGDTRADALLFAAVDALCAVTLVLTYGIEISTLPVFALPLLAIGLSRYLGICVEGRLAAFWRDRALHMAGFVLAASVGYLGETLAVFALGALLQLLLRSHRN